MIGPVENCSDNHRDDQDVYVLTNDLFCDTDLDPVGLGLGHYSDFVSASESARTLSVLLSQQAVPQDFSIASICCNSDHRLVDCVHASPLPFDFVWRMNMSFLLAMVSEYPRAWP